jgi:hypothetical protein
LWWAKQEIFLLLKVNGFKFPRFARKDIMKPQYMY